MLVALRRVTHADVRPGVGEEQHIARESLLRVDGNGQRLEVHEDEPCGVDGFGSTPGDDDGDDVTDETHDVARQERAPHPLVEPGNRRRLERAQIDVLRRKDLCPGQLQRGRGVDLQDPRVRRGRADEDGVQRVRQVEVLDVEAVARQEARVLAPEDPLTHHSAHAAESRRRGLRRAASTPASASRPRPGLSRGSDPRPSPRSSSSARACSRA